MTSPHVHVPYEKIDDYLSFINSYKLNLEIYFNSNVLDRNGIQNDVKNLKNRLKYSPDITIHGPFMDLCPGAVDAKIRQVTIDRFVQTVELTEPLSPRVIVFHSGYEKWKYGLKPEIWLDGSVLTWGKVLGKTPASTKIAIENIVEEDSSNLALLMSAMGSERFGLCFDTGHFNLFSRVSLNDWLSGLIPHVIEVHAHDNDKSADSHLPPGDGTFDFAGFFGLLHGASPILTLEAHTPERVILGMERLGGMIARP